MLVRTKENSHPVSILHALSLTRLKSSGLLVFANVHDRLPLLLLVTAVARPVKSQGPVHIQLLAQRVTSGAQSDGQDDTERDQLWRDLLQGAEALGDCVCWRLYVSRFAWVGIRDGFEADVPECSSFCEAVSVPFLS